MKSYFITTGSLFSLITLAHVWLPIQRGHLHHSDLLIVVPSLALSVWAWRLAFKSAA